MQCGRRRRHGSEEGGKRKEGGIKAPLKVSLNPIN